MWDMGLVMYQIGDQVVYGVHGVCRITDETVRLMDKKKIRFYVLEPLDQTGAIFYVPAENPVALAKLHPLMTREKWKELLSGGTILNGTWIGDMNQRKQCYRELIGSGDRVAMMQMLHRLYQYKQLQQSQGKRIHLCDENFLKDARKLLDGELSLVLGLGQNEVEPYVLQALKQ